MFFSYAYRQRLTQIIIACLLMSLLSRADAYEWRQYPGSMCRVAPYKTGVSVTSGRVMEIFAPPGWGTAEGLPPGMVIGFHTFCPIVEENDYPHAAIRRISLSVLDGNHGDHVDGWFAIVAPQSLSFLGLIIPLTTDPFVGFSTVSIVPPWQWSEPAYASWTAGVEVWVLSEVDYNPSAVSSYAQEY